MRSIFFPALAVLSLALSSNNLHADVFNITLDSGASINVPLTEHDVNVGGLTAQQYTYTATTIGVLNQLNLASVTNSIFTATYLALSPIASTLNVTDICTSVTVLGSAAPACQGFAFSFTGVKLGDGEDGLATIDALVAASANVGLGFVNLGIDGGDIQLHATDLANVEIGGASGSFSFAPAPTPEPSSLCLMATGLATAGGFIRRRLIKTAA